MVDGREFESLLDIKGIQLNVNVADEIRRATKEISQITGRPIFSSKTLFAVAA
ncbi:MAG: hypothetical protein ACR2PY_05220 [Salinispira sp.]